MRTVAVLVLFAAPAAALADDSATTRGAFVASQATASSHDEARAATFALGGHARWSKVQRDADLRRNGVRSREDVLWEVGSEGELRLSAGSLPTLGVAASAYLGMTALEALPLETAGVANIASLSAEHDAVPKLLQPRDLLRGTYDRFSVTLGDVDEQLWLGDTTGGGITLAFVFQDGIARVDGTGFASFFRKCRRRNGGVRGCVGLWTQEIYTVELVGDGDEDPPLSSTFGFFPAPITHVRLGALRLDARAGLLAAKYRAPDAGAIHGEHRLHTLGYDLRTTTRLGRAVLVFGVRRSLRPSMLFDFMLEDRAEATASYRAGEWNVVASGAAAMTDLYTPELTRMGRAATGGADLAISRHLDAWTVAVTAGAARTFYPSPAPGPLTPAFAATGTVSLGYELGDRR